MARNRNSDLRDHLFEVLEALKEGDQSMSIEKAEAICNVAQTIINSAKVDVELAKVAGGLPARNQFFGVEAESRQLPKIEAPKVLR